MALVRPLDTKPEQLVRQLVQQLGYRRYQLNRYDLPGRPDIVVPQRHKVIFVHGCFWHRHRGCARTSLPGRNGALWQEKFRRTVQRDRKNLRVLRVAGWDVLVVWECEANERAALIERIRTFLRASKKETRV
jgi:DNA mismatch endonuclease (patch repair protein)